MTALMQVCIPFFPLTHNQKVGTVVLVVWSGVFSLAAYAFLSALAPFVLLNFMHVCSPAKDAKTYPISTLPP